MNRLLVLFAVLALTPSSRASSSRARVFEEIVYDVAFVGVVECVRAGGVVSDHRIVATFKGSETPGSVVRIRFGVDFFEPQYPIALVGERRVVAAGTTPSVDKMNTAIGGPVPLLWRHYDAHLSAPFPQGAYLLSGDSVDFGVEEGRFGRTFGCSPCDLEEFEAAVRAFDAAPAERQELLLLKREAWDILGRLARHHEEAAAAAERVGACGSVEELVQALLEFANDGPSECRPGALGALGSGRSVTRELVRALAAEVFPGGSAKRDGVLVSLDYAIDGPKARSRARPTVAVVAEARERLSEDPSVLPTVVAILAEEDPAAIVSALATWTNPRASWHDAHRGYVLGSTFGALVRDDAPLHLERLLDAKNAYVRVAAAVYLTMLDEPAGAPHLLRFVALDGGPGAWAALTLARRGDTSILPRLFEIFDVPVDGGMADVPLGNLRHRVLVLLSNSAAAAGVDAPPRIANNEAGQGRLEAWWGAVGDGVALIDPWLPELSAQGID